MTNIIGFLMKLIWKAKLKTLITTRQICMRNQNQTFYSPLSAYARKTPIMKIDVKREIT